MAKKLRRILLSAPFLVFATALLVRVLYFLQSMHSDPMFYQPILDSMIHHNWAFLIAKGDWIGSDSFFRAPLYPYFLGTIYAIFGVNFIIPRIIQMIVGALNCVLTLKIGETLLGKRIAVISGFVAAFYPLLIYFDNELLIPTVLTFLILVAFYMTIRYAAQPVGKHKWYLTGIMWGLAAITRPNILLFVLFLPLWLRQRLKDKFWTAAGFGILGLMTTILPVTVRNYAVSKEIVPIAWQGGVNFYIGNNPLSDGKTAIVPGTRKSWMGGFEDARRIAEESTGRKLKNSEVDRYWMKQGIDFITREPGKAFVLLLKKAYMFWGGYEIPNNRDLYFFTRPTFLKFLFFKTGFFQFPFGVLLPLSLVGIFTAFKKKKDISLMLLLITAYFISFLMFFVCARYRIPIIPFLIVLAGYAVVDTIERIRKKESLLYQVLIFVGTLIFFNINITKIKDNPALNYLTIGSIEHQRGNFQSAINYIQRSMTHYSKDIEVLMMLADSYRRTDRPEQALSFYLQALQIEPNRPEICENVGALYFYLRRLNEAKYYLNEAIKYNPLSEISYVNLGHIYFVQDSLGKAILSYQKALDIKSDLIDALYYLGLCEYKRRDFASAEKYWKRLLRIEPNHTPALQGLQAISEMQ